MFTPAPPLPCFCQTMNISFVISTQPTQFQAVAFDPNFEANIAKLAEFGYDGVELAVREPAQLDIANVTRVLDQYHLHVPALGTGQAFVEEHLSFTDPDEAVRAQAIERVRTHIALSSQLADTPIVIIGLIRGQVQKNVSLQQAHGWLVDAMKSLARSAQEHGVRLAIEPINRYETNLINGVTDALALIQEIGADNVGVLYDTFHANIEEPHIETGLLVCRTRLFHVHLADSNRWYPGAGHTDFRRVFATLRAMKYAGWVSAEILPKPNVLTAAEQTIKNLTSLLRD